MHLIIIEESRSADCSVLDYGILHDSSSLPIALKFDQVPIDFSIVFDNNDSNDDGNDAQ